LNDRLSRKGTDANVILYQTIMRVNPCTRNMLRLVLE
jgi:hypothetical protein